MVANESDGHVSQSLEEQSANTTAALTNTLSFNQNRILSGSNFGLGQDNLRNLCQVKTAIPSTLNPTNVLLPSTIATASGSLDTCFGAGGKRTTNFSGTSRDQATALALQSDGKIVVAGYSISIDGIDNDFALARYNADGSLDTSFDSDGKVTTNFSGTSRDQATALALQSDGKIVVAGSSYSINGTNNDFALARYNADGSLDTSFDSDGKVTTNFSGRSSDQATDLALQSDGKIVVAGYSYSGGTEVFALARYNADGSLDTSFDSDGKVTTNVSGTDSDRANALALQSDGKIVVAGYSNIGGSFDFVLARYNADGSLDTTFDTDGKVTTNFSGRSIDQAFALALQSNGKIVVAGGGGGNFDFALARYNADGSLDTTFDSDGLVTTNISGTNINGKGSDTAFALALQSDGKIVVAGYSNIAGGPIYFALARYNPNGSLDTTFDSDGKVNTNINGRGTDFAYALALQSDGKIVVAGYSSNGGNNDFALVRYNP